VSADMLLAHGGRQPSLEFAEQLAEPADMSWPTYQPICCGQNYVARWIGLAGKRVG